MSKIFKNLIPYWRWIILIFVFLIAQAYCDLALPAYTSDIIDVGIQDHGIEHILPKEITSEDYQMAQTFMLSDEKEKFTDCYEAQDASKSDDGVAKYKLTAVRTHLISWMRSFWFLLSWHIRLFSRVSRWMWMHRLSRRE